MKSRISTFYTWQNMIQRCTNPNLRDWKDYGGRGIMVCARWLASFENFLADMGERPLGLWLDRKDNDGNYEPDNCRWITPKESAANRRPWGSSPRQGSILVSIVENAPEYTFLN